MMHVENENPNIFERIRRWGDTLPFANWRFPEKWIVPIASVCIGYRTKDSNYKKWGGDISFGAKGNESLFRNGIIFVRIIFPFFIGIGIRWRGKGEGREFMQTYIGIKLNGEVAIAPRFRIQSDKSAAAGTTGPNSGQASGWNEGNK